MRSLMPQTLSQDIKIEENSSSPIQQASTLQKMEVNRSRTWKRDELYLIAAFLYYNSDKFSSQSSKKHFKIFKLMSAFVQSRNINQCRSYTNKLIKSFGNIANINAYFRDSLPHYTLTVSELRERNEHILTHQGNLIQSDDSINQIYHSIDKNIADTTPDHKNQENHSQQHEIIIPQAQKWTPSITNHNLLHQTMPQYEHNQDIYEIFRRICFQSTLGVNFYAFFGNQTN